MGEGGAQHGLSGCWRVNCAVLLLYAQALGFDRYGLGWGQQPVKVNVDLSVTPEITLQLAGIFTFVFSLFLFLSQDERVNTGGLIERKGKRSKTACITIFLAGAMMQSP